MEKTNIIRIGKILLFENGACDEFHQETGEYLDIHVASNITGFLAKLGISVKGEQPIDIQQFVGKKLVEAWSSDGWNGHVVIHGAVEPREKIAAKRTLRIVYGRGRKNRAWNTTAVLTKKAKTLEPRWSRKGLFKAFGPELRNHWWFDKEGEHLSSPVYEDIVFND